MDNALFLDVLMKIALTSTRDLLGEARREVHVAQMGRSVLDPDRVVKLMRGAMEQLPPSRAGAAWESMHMLDRRWDVPAMSTLGASSMPTWTPSPTDV